MFSNRLALAAVGVACVTAAGAGSYVATRHNAAVPVVSATGAPSETAEVASAVQETEALVAEHTSRPAEAPASGRERSVSRVESRPAPSRNTSTGKSITSPVPAERPADNPTPAPEPPPLPAPDPQPLTRDDVPARAPEPPARTYEELVVTEGSVIGLQVETALSSERARVEDRVEARVVRDVRVSGNVAIPAGSRALGSVMVVERGGKVKERARLGIRFHTLVLADGTRLPITTETVYRQGDAPGNEAAAKIGGGAAAGAILGAIIGGAKGAAIGGTVGAGAGTTAVMAGDRNAATFPAGTDVTARILSPVTVTVEK